MRPKALLPRMSLIACLALGGLSLAGCEDEADPRTWVAKLPADTKRPAAIHTLRQMWEARISNAHGANPLADPSVRQFLDATLPSVVETFNSHPEEISTRKDAIEILAGSLDNRAVPALLNALDYHPGNTDSERIALRAAQALKEMHPQSNPAVVQKLVATIDRASGNSGNPPQIREACILALGAIGDRSVVERLRSVLKRPIDQQEIRTARAAADALGQLHDPAGVDALVYGLYLNVNRNNAFNNCTRGLMLLGPTVAVPALINTLQNQNADVTQLLASYASVPNAPPAPPGFQQSTAVDVLRNFADPRAIAPLLAILTARNPFAPAGAPPAAAHTAPTDPAQAGAALNLRAAAAETLAYTALALPATDPQRNAVFDAIATVFREATPGSPEDMAPGVAPALALIGDPRAPGVIEQRLAARELQAPDTVPFRLGLLMPLASAARHGDVPAFDRLAAQAQTQLEGLIAADPDAAGEVRPILAQLETIRQVVSVVRDCNDGDLACYQGKLASTEKAVVRKAAYMIAWTGGDNPGARQALLARADNPDPLVRRSINVALDALAPHGCAECVTRLQSVIDAEQNQESKSLMHLEAQMLISRLQNRH